MNLLAKYVTDLARIEPASAALPAGAEHHVRDVVVADHLTAGLQGVDHHRHLEGKEGTSYRDGTTSSGRDCSKVTSRAGFFQIRNSLFGL